MHKLGNYLITPTPISYQLLSRHDIIQLKMFMTEIYIALFYCEIARCWTDYSVDKRVFDIASLAGSLYQCSVDVTLPDWDAK